MNDISKDSLVMHLEFEETSGSTAADTSFQGQNNLGNLRNGTRFYNEGGQFGGVAEFDGVDDYIVVSSSEDLNLTPHAKRTVSLWFKADWPPATGIANRLTDGKQVLYEEGGTARGLNIYLDNGQLYVGGWNEPESNWSGTYLATDAIEENTWHQVSLVLDTPAGETSLQAGGLRGYLDGELFGQGNASELGGHARVGLGAVDGQTQFHDGEVWGTGNNALDGYLDDVRVYNRALSQEEITRLAGVTPESSPTGFPIGTNLTSVTYYSTQIPFQDRFMSSRPWQAYDSRGNRQRSVEEELELDSNGWLTSLPGDGMFVETVMRLEGENFPGGEYVVLYDGEGTLEYGNSATVLSSQPGREVVDFTGKWGLFIKIKETDPDQTGDYIRNLRVVPKEIEQTYTQELFNPEFIEKVKDFKVFRFMDWMDTNDSKQQEWRNRPTPESATFDNLGVPVETMVELSNLTDTDPWFTMPHMATDEYVTQFAQYVKDHLDPGLKVYVEYSNEVWNPQFEQSDWVRQQGLQQWPDSNQGGTVKKTDWFSKRTVEIVGQWDEVFGADNERVIGVMGAQAANFWLGEKLLEYGWSSDNLTHEDYGIDAIAIAPYFGGYIGGSDNEAEVESWTSEPDGGLNKLFDEITRGGVLSNGPQGGALQLSYSWMKGYADLAQQENLELIAYEGGQHIVGRQHVNTNEAITELFIQANRDPRMGEAYEEYFTQWFELGGSTFANFADIASSDRWGSWGALENVEQDSSPKYDALMELISSSDSSLSVA